MNAGPCLPAPQRQRPTGAEARSSGPGPPRRLRRSLLVGVAGFHAAILLSVVAVPVYAVAQAVCAAHAEFGAGRSGPLVAFDRWLVLLGNTAVVCGVALVTALGVGLLAGLTLARTDLPCRRLFAALAVLGASMPVYVTAIFVFSSLPASRLADSALACGLLYGLIYSPLAIIVLGATFRCAERELEDLASLDARPVTVLLRVTMPQASWGLAVLGLLIVLLVGTDFTLTDLLFVRTFAEEVYTQYALGQSAAGPVLTSIPMLFTISALLILVQARYHLLGEHAPRMFLVPPRTFSLGRWRPLIVAAALAALVLLVGRPATCLLERLGAFDSFRALADAARAMCRDLLVSTLCAAVGASVVVVAALGLAWALLRSGRLRYPVAVAVVLLLALPAPVAGISLIGLLNRPGLPGMLYDSWLVIVVGYVVRFLPIGVLLLAAAVQRVPREIESAARIDGCDWLAVQRYVYWPAVIPEALIAWLVIVILCFAEIGTTKLVVPPNWNTASVRAFNLIHGGVDSNLAVLAILSLAIILTLWLSLIGLLKWRLAHPRLDFNSHS